jgi:YbgC/YbaW family acyl-CoA thioester hydrolase
MDKIKNELDNYRHTYSGEVKFSEVDSFGVVHNIAYLYWIEWARTQYLFDIAHTKNSEYFTKDLPLMTVTTNIDYLSSLRFADEYKVLTKVSKLGRSSVTFENLTVAGNDDRIINKASSVLVYVDAATQRSKPFPDIYKQRIIAFEGMDK